MSATTTNSLPTRPARFRHSAARSTRPEPYLPVPPTDDEKVLYFGAQQRWIFFVFLTSFAGVMYGLARLALDSMWTSLLYELVAMQSAATLISLQSSTRRRRATRAGHRGTVDGYRPDRYPSVDVFLPSAGEPLRVAG